MNKVYRKLASYFLLLCILSVIIPVNLFHDHEQDYHCDRTDASIESNPCHVSVYHGQSKEQKCEHKSHFSDVHEACEFCKFLTPRQFDFTAFTNYQYKIIAVSISKDFAIEYDSLILQYFSSSILYRGPPTC